MSRFIKLAGQAAGGGTVLPENACFTSLTSKGYNYCDTIQERSACVSPEVVIMNCPDFQPASTNLLLSHNFYNYCCICMDMTLGGTEGTSSYMPCIRLVFNDVLEDAKQKGFTSDHESKLDIGGYDAAHKLTLLTSLAYGSTVDFELNEIEGIGKITIEDIKFAKQLGYRIKLISESSVIEGNIYASTKPKLISKENPIANTEGALNAISVETDQLKNLYLEGEGAGGFPTASSVLSDIYEISYSSNYKSLGFSMSKLVKFEKYNSSDLEIKYYLRIRVKDKPGVLSMIKSYFNDANISVEKILQIPDNSTEGIPILITTHKIKSSELLSSVKKISDLDFVFENISVIPIEY